MLGSMKEQFGAWMNGYGKKYATEKEYNERLEIFSQNAKMVYEHNAGKHSYTSKPQLSPRKYIRNLTQWFFSFMVSSEVE